MNIITTLDELKDSRILYEKDVPHFGYFLLIVLLALIIAVSLWSTHAKRPYIVMANGAVQGVDKNYVMSEYSGEIYEVDMQEGQNVIKDQTLFKVKSNDIEMQIKQLESQRSTYATTASKYSKLVKSIKNNKNCFSSKNKSDSLYYSQYKAYEEKLAQQVIDPESLKDMEYSDKEIADAMKLNEAAREQIKQEAINAAANSQKQYQLEVDAIDSQINALKSGEANYTVTANASGKLHMLGEYKDGMVVQAGSPIASISDANGDKAIIEATVTASDRSRIAAGNDVTVAVSGLQQNVYGTLKGKVTEIDSDISVSEDGQQSFFKIKIKPESTVLKTKDGETVNITNGMAVEARIVYDKITYFDYVMNAIGVKVSQ